MRAGSFLRGARAGSGERGQGQENEGGVRRMRTGSGESRLKGV